MAINAYTGVMGSGKTYEVVSSVILPAIVAGRRVVTNIHGLNEELIHAYLLSKNRELKQGKLGSIVDIDDDQIKQRNFFPDEKQPDLVSIVQPGDLVVVDEAWRHWNKDQKISPEAMQFFRMHRHYVHPETGVSCDVALIFQSILDVHRSVRSVVEMTARTTKIKTLGLAKTYRIELYEGDKLTKTARFARKVNQYDKAIFPLYKSYAGGEGKEVAIDKRQNVLRNPIIWIMMLIMMIVSVFAFRFLFGYFKKNSSEQPKDVAASIAKSPLSELPLQSSVRPSPQVSANLRIAGEVTIGGQHWIVLADSEGRLRYESPSFFVGRGIWKTGEIDGQRVTPWTGPIKPTTTNSVQEVLK